MSGQLCGKTRTFLQFLFITTGVAFSILGTAEFTCAQVANLRAAYSFDESTGTIVADASGNANTGTLTDTAWTQGRIRAGLAFNGSSSRVSVADSASLRSPTTAITASAWVQPNGTPQPWSSILHKVNTTNFVSYGFGQNAGNVRRLSGYLQVNGTRHTTPMSPVLGNVTWYYVVLSWQSGQPLTLTVYNANGTVFATQSTPQALTGTITYSNSPLHFGEDEAGNNWKGTIDEVRVYNRVLSASEIQTNMITPIGGGAADRRVPIVSIASPTSIPTYNTVSSPMTIGGKAQDDVGVVQATWVNDRGGSGTANGTGSWTINGLVLQTGRNVVTVTARDAAYNTATDTLTIMYTPLVGGGLAAAYGFDEGSGTRVGDSSGNGNTGTLTSLTWAVGRIRSGLAFNGSSSRVSIADSASVRSATSAITASAWVQPNGSPEAWSSILHKVNVTNNVSYGFGQNGGNVRRLSGYLQVNGVNFTTPMTPALADLTWYYVVLSWQSGHPLTLTVYNASGTVFATRSTTQTPTGTISYSSNPLHLGEDEAGHNWEGTIDEVRIYSRVLSASEIQTNMTTPVGGGAADRTAPVVSIVSPTSLPTYSTSSSPVSIGGKAGDNVGVTQVTWVNNRGGSGTASGTTSWTAGGIVLQRGPNVVTVTARDAANNAVTDTLTITYTPVTGGSLAAAYNFDEGTGTTVSDTSGNSNTGTLSNTTWTVGWVGTALAFNGNNSRVSIADSASLRSPTSAITVSAWIEANGTPQAWSSIVQRVNSSNRISYGFGQNAGNVRRLSGYVQINGIIYTTPMTPPLGNLTWYYAVLSWQSGQPVRLTVYNANGTVFATQSTPQAPSGRINYSNSPLYIGEDEVGNNWRGRIDEVRIDNQALSASEIQANLGLSNPILAQSGQWTAPMTWPLVAVSSTLLPTGRVLLWDGQNAGTDAQVWSSETGTFSPITSNDNIFCAGQSLLRDGRVLVAGGHVANHEGIADANVFNPTTQTWAAAPPMRFARWYPTTTTLPDGRILVTAGEVGCNAMPPDGSFHPECVADIPEIYNATTNSWTQLSGASLAVPYYPHMFVLPDGKVLNTSTAEGPIQTRVLDVATQTWTVADPVVSDGGSAAMYQPGKVIKSGTSTNPDNPSVAAKANTYVLDATQATPAWRQVAPMASPRVYHYLTLLPDGSVLVTGGGRVTDVFNLGAAALSAELWSPATERWTTLAGMKTPRLYHSTALLLPDGKVLVAGGGRFGVDQFNAEVFSPPYLFKGPRPTITSAPATLTYGAGFTVGTPNGATLATVSLLRLGAVTHSFNFDQRFLKLTFQQVSGGITVQAPANANLAPPGYYMLFVVNTTGVPSVAKIVRFP